MTFPHVTADKLNLTYDLNWVNRVGTLAEQRADAALTTCRACNLALDIMRDAGVTGKFTRAIRTHKRNATRRYNYNYVISQYACDARNRIANHYAEFDAMIEAEYRAMQAQNRARLEAEVDAELAVETGQWAYLVASD